MSAAKHKELVVRALQNMLGDDLIRARNAFRNFSTEEMRQQHGMSGKTRAEILETYVKHDAEVRAAIAWVESIK
jgi:hypothetical protein